MPNSIFDASPYYDYQRKTDLGTLLLARILPWSPGAVTIEMTYEFDYNWYKVYVNNATYPDRPYVGILDRNQLLQLDQASINDLIASGFAEHFLSISNPVGDHIVLGEN